MIVISKPSTFADEVADYRTTRMDLLVRDEQPVKLQGGARIVLHMIPSNAFSSEHCELATSQESLQPLGYVAGQASRRFNFDGFVKTVPSSNGDRSESYAQVFHNGIIEAVKVGFVAVHEGRYYIAIRALEDELIARATEYCQIQQALGVSTPISASLALLGVQAYRFVTYGPNARSDGYEIDRDNLVIPPVEVDSFDVDFATALRPVFNRLWNAAGFSRSENYHADGSRVIL